MKAILSAIGLGTILASTCNLACAQWTVNTTQQGNGNTAYAEQVANDPVAQATATILQIGNNNHAGDPATHNAGIIQRNVFYFGPATAKIEQRGNENTAAIVQDSVAFSPVAAIAQTGNRNAAAISEYNVFYGPATISQTGNDNVATLDQQFTESPFHGLQDGWSNRMSVVQYAVSKGGASVTQSGSQNEVSLIQQNTLGKSTIVQTGSMNIAASTLTGGDVETITISQTGTRNTALTSQSDFSNAGTISQSGSGNTATLKQSLTTNIGDVTQNGNFNIATIRQSGVGTASFMRENTAYIIELGDGFTAAISQTGSDNHAGVYQH